MKRTLLLHPQGFLTMMLLGLFSVGSYAADCDSVNVPLTSKFRFLGPWSSDGKALYLDPEGDNVSAAMINYVKQVLPESVNLPNSNSDFFGSDVQLNTELTKKSKVYVTMVDEGAGWKNTLGYYTYALGNPPSNVYDIDSLVVLFPNVSQPNVVNPGDKILLGEFPANTGIGYFIIAQGWVEDTICIPSHIVFSDPHLNTFTTAKYQQQTILLNYEPENQFLLCFEDQKRPGGDNDFNDAVFYITADPGAIDTTNIAKVPSAILSGDTTLCSASAKAKLRIDLTGVGPWNVVYAIGGLNTTISNITQSPYFFETSVIGTFTLVSVKDKTKSGIASGSATVNVSVPTVAITDVTNNCGDEPAVIDLTFTGNGPWSVGYLLNNAAVSANSVNPTLSLPIEQLGTFQLKTVSDAYCSNTASGSTEIKHYEQPIAVLSGNAVICNGESASVNITLSGTAPFILTYTDGSVETTVTTNLTTYAITSSVPKTYTLLSVEDKQCIGDASGTATISDGSEGLDVEIIAPELSCSDEQIELALEGNTDNVSVVWSTNGEGVLQNSDQLVTVYTPTENESGEVVFTVQINNGCVSTTISKTVTILEKPNAEFSVSPNDKLYTNSLISFMPDDTGADEYAWDFGDGNSSQAVNASHEYEEGGKYQVTLTVSISGCENSVNKEYDVYSKDELYVPNAFNPGALNSENQVVKVYGNNVSEDGFFFKIVNRWGKVMYETKSFSEANTIGWNGVNNNTSEQQEMNVFTYLLRGKFIEGEEFQRVGTVTQVR
ncbi:MAG: DUF4114 domain-containing protein [Cyclobacteriaceae bacterium]|nr:DUF4114 domain-containing protein [Cyclobacteriaceae bacterium]